MAKISDWLNLTPDIDDSDLLPMVDVSDTGDDPGGSSFSITFAKLRGYLDDFYAADPHNHAGVYEPADSTIVKEADVDDLPVDGADTVPISSNWAYDHADSHAPSDADNTASNETSHADVVVDGDFSSEGLLKRGAAAGSYSVVPDDSPDWDAAYAHSQAAHAPSNADNTAANETSHADVVQDGDFNSDGFLKRSGGAGSYAVDTNSYALDSHDHDGTYEPVDATIIREADVDDTPVDSATNVPVSSNWAYDHANTHAPSNADNTAANETSHANLLHDNVGGEIAAVTAKATPTTSDILLIEDAAASNAKKRITIGDLPSGGGGISEVSDDTSPTLGGDLDVSTHSIVTTFTDGYVNIEGDGDGGVYLAQASGPTATFFSVDAYGLYGKFNADTGLNGFNLANSSFDPLFAVHPTGQVVIYEGDLTFIERSDHASSPRAGEGYLWVKDDAPCSLIFTDDAGTDYDLTASTGGGGAHTLQEFTPSDYSPTASKYEIWAYDKRFKFNMDGGTDTLELFWNYGGGADRQIALGVRNYENITNGNGSQSLAVGAYALMGSSSLACYPTGCISIGHYNMGEAHGSHTGTIAIGRNAAKRIAGGDYNIIIGEEAVSIGDMDGDNNIAIGYQAMESLDSGSYNIALGYRSLDVPTTCSYNVAIGQQALKYTTTNNNVGIGTNALYYNTAGYRNIAIGESAILGQSGSSTGSGNVGIGFEAGKVITTGQYNTCLGYQAGNLVTSGSNNTCLGNNSDVSSGSVTNEITLGNSAISTLRCNQQTISSLSDRRDKTDIKEISYGLDFVLGMRPVSFVWDRRDGTMKDKPAIGFIAQELQALEDLFDSRELTRMVVDSNPDRLESRPLEAFPIIVKAIQELNQKVEVLSHA